MFLFRRRKILFRKLRFGASPLIAKLRRPYAAEPTSASPIFVEMVCTMDDGMGSPSVVSNDSKDSPLQDGYKDYAEFEIPEEFGDYTSAVTSEQCIHEINQELDTL
jgi:hypothetical protein